MSGIDDAEVASLCQLCPVLGSMASRFGKRGGQVADMTPAFVCFIHIGFH